MLRDNCIFEVNKKLPQAIMRSIMLAFVLLVLLQVDASAQKKRSSKKETPKPFVLGTTDKLMSAVLNEERVLNVYLPPSYSKDTVRHYPVIYLLDGSADEDFVHIVGLVQFLNMIQVMPETIVVGIGNVDRRRDFTHPTTVKEDMKLVPVSGGSAQFIEYIAQEVQPYVETKYRTNSVKTIIGQSLGGLLATEILLKKPELFNNYIIVSPSLWWDNESLLSRSWKLLNAHDYTNVKVYLSIGTEGDRMEDDADKLLQQLRHVNDLKVMYVPLPEESHLTILHRSVYKAFEMLNKK